MTPKSRVLMYHAPSDQPTDLANRLQEQGFTPKPIKLGDALEADAAPQPGDLAVMLAAPATNSDDATHAIELLKYLVQENIATLVRGGDRELHWESGPLVEWVAPDAKVDELTAKVETLARYAPLVRGLERELKHVQRLGEQLNRYFGEIDQEMRLAGRLQRDFLPRKLPQVANVSFSTLYRPASWVSGDMYDIFRIDEHHLGMFLADAMGHGVAAGLLTMFLRQALVSKRISGASYALIPPSEVLDDLHNCLLRQQLPNSQFVTAAYGIIDCRTREFTVARAGHPYPLHIRTDGQIDELRSDGSLLGLAGVPAEFQEIQAELVPGEKIIFYTDGIEDIVAMPGLDHCDQSDFTEEWRQWAPLPGDQLVKAVEHHLDHRDGSLHPVDDITMVLLELSD